MKTTFGRRLFLLSLSCGYYAVSSVSVSVATRLEYVSYLLYLLRMYADLTIVFCLRHIRIRFVSVIVLLSSALIRFSS